MPYGWLVIAVLSWFAVSACCPVAQSLHGEPEVLVKVDGVGKSGVGPVTGVPEAAQRAELLDEGAMAVPAGWDGAVVEAVAGDEPDDPLAEPVQFGFDCVDAESWPADHAAAVIVRDRTVLLIRRRQKEGTLLCALPSGGVEPGETAEQPAERETLEEVGLTVHAQSVLGERIHPATRRRMIYVACAPDAGEPRVIDTDEIAELAWVKKPQLEEYVPHGFFEAVQDYLDAALD